MIRKGDPFLEKVLQLGQIIADAVIFTEILNATASLVVGRVALHFVRVIDALFRNIEGLLVEIRCVDARAIEKPLLMQQDRHRINFLARGTASVPDLSERVSFKHGNDALPYLLKE